jgi:predicted Zn-dependent protease
MITRRWWRTLLGSVLLAAACARTSPEAREPEDLAGLARAGREALKRGEVQQAAALLQRAVVLAPEDPNLLYVCARAESLAGDRDLALQHLARTVDLGSATARCGSRRSAPWRPGRACRS